MAVVVPTAVELPTFKGYRDDVTISFTSNDPFFKLYEIESLIYNITI